MVYGEGLNVREWLYIEDNSRVIDSIKIHNELGQLSETKFTDGIQKTIQWYLDKKSGRKTSFPVSTRIPMKKRMVGVKNV